MKNFRTFEQAKQELKELQEYIDLIENYQPENLTQIVVFSYTLFGNTKETATFLNNQNYSIDGRPFEANDISDLITSPPAKNDLLHKKIKSLYLKKKRANHKTVITYNPYQYH
ncbi:hypothetical protein [Lysinibacillus antri]|uniref:Uncharacterized protein n=1 Tax=Lysinibacillus antri TaxID=2498145 RepID=A0A432L702_9BACI|nr:hypothetical protein [Lysinibacillus antri]RUL46535.1 hypothetical protein EK386_18995 [Lysinibacillus antri]